MPESDSNPLNTEFVARLTTHQGLLYGYIVSLMSGLDQANDVLQETNLKLCRKADQYDPEQPFLRWAYAFARNEVLSWRTRQARSRLIFDDELTHRIGEVFEAASLDSERQLSALEACVERLPERQRELIRSRYARSESVQDIASRVGMHENAAAALFYRIRKALAACVELTLGKDIPA